MDSVHIHLERLRRHYQVAVHTYDAVSLLDLSHALRLWVEMKAVLRDTAPALASPRQFRTGIPARKVLSAARGHRYVFSYMPGGVRTHASRGTLASGPDISQGGTIGVALRSMPPLLELGRFCYVSTVFDQPLVKALEAEQVTQCDFSDWMGAEAVRLCYEQSEGHLQAVTLSREMIIKRVANALDGSHPSIVEGQENRFDEPVQHLLQYSVGGLPLPYYVLLKVAQDLLEKSPLLDANTNASDAPR